MASESPALASSAVPPEVVLWDLGGVVFDVELDRARETWHELTGRTGAELDELLFESGLKDAMDRGTASLDEVRRALGLGSEAWTRVWNSVLYLRDPVDAMIREVAGRARAGVLSNTDPEHARWVRENAPFAASIERWILSYEVRAMKPEVAIYEAALEAFAGVAPARVVFLDDRVENVEGARALGIDAVLCRSAADARAALASRGLL